MSRLSVAAPFMTGALQETRKLRWIPGEARGVLSRRAHVVARRDGVFTLARSFVKTKRASHGLFASTRMPGVPIVACMKTSTRDGRLFFTLAVLALVAAPGCMSPNRIGWHAYNGGDYATALAEWTPLAEQGDADAQYLVGLMHDDGQGMPADASVAAHWYRLSAEQGYAPAQNNLGALYFAGHGVGRSSSEAARWFRLAAEQGFAAARSNLGVLQASGRGGAPLAGEQLAMRARTGTSTESVTQGSAQAQPPADSVASSSRPALTSR